MLSVSLLSVRVITSHVCLCVCVCVVKAREAEGKYKEALAAYETAREYDSMVRILLDHLNNPQQAVQIVQESKSVEGARLVAK